MARLSVVMPVFDDEAHLQHAVRRVLDQRDADLEVVLVDDGSTDGSAAIADAAAEADPRVRVVRMPRNGGVARARRAGVEAARGDWIWFVDSDDDWPADAAASLLAETADGVDVVVCRARSVFTTGRPPTAIAAPPASVVDGATALRLLLTGGITGHLWNKLFRRELLRRIEFTPARVQSDLAMTAQALSEARTVACGEATVYEYRVRAGSVITSRTTRAESLDLVDRAVRGAVARHPDLVGSHDHRYFTSRYILLSGMKDAVLGGYAADERPVRIAAARRRVGADALACFVRARDWRRLTLAVAARGPLPVYRRLLAAADR